MSGCFLSGDTHSSRSHRSSRCRITGPELSDLRHPDKTSHLLDLPYFQANWEHPASGPAINVVRRGKAAFLSLGTRFLWSWYLMAQWGADVGIWGRRLCVVGRRGWLAGLCDAEQSIRNFALSKRIMSVMPLDWKAQLRWGRPKLPEIVKPLVSI